MAEIKRRAEPIPSTSRGIQNVQVQTSDQRFTDATNKRLLSTNLQEKINTKREAANDASFNAKMEEATLLEEEQLQQEEEARAVAQTQRKVQKKKRPQRTNPLGTFSIWMGIGIVCTSYVFQLIFALLSLISFYTAGVIDDFKNNNLIGMAIGWVYDFSNALPVKDVGYALWGFSVIIVIATFAGFWLWYSFLKIDPFHSVMSFWVTILALSASMVPVTNLFPLLVLWVIYTNGNALFSKY